ncbi:hypothetical protein VTK73DRAFT_4260 [Phialemonium thermophilum]|uniref:Uncharacterized protein n=1 Tax=Phialemonium thermophilum TaxID=223376 RepID=A0ABR3VAE1_9PEZI
MTMGPSLRSGSHSDPSHTYTYSTQPPPSAHSPTYPPSSLSRSNSSNVSPVSPVGTMGPPPTPAFQRTPIDPSRIVCLGPLPENVPIPRHRPSIPQLLRSEGPIPPADSPPVATTTTAASQPAATPTTTTTPLHSIPDDIPRGPAHRRRSTETLGSDYTVEEENRIREEGPHTNPTPTPRRAWAGSTRASTSSTFRSWRRRDTAGRKTTTDDKTGSEESDPSPSPLSTPFPPPPLLPSPASAARYTRPAVSSVVTPHRRRRRA